MRTCLTSHTFTPMQHPQFFLIQQIFVDNLGKLIVALPKFRFLYIKNGSASYKSGYRHRQIYSYTCPPCKNASELDKELLIFFIAYSARFRAIISCLNLAFFLAN